jgi:hypothetical protein
MGRRNIILGFLIALIIITGCKEIIEYDEKSVREALVVSGILEKDKAIEIRLSKSLNRFDDVGFQQLADKTVVYYQDGVRMGELRNAGNGRYVSDGFLATPGKTYRIEIYDNGKEIASAETFFPMPQPITNLDSIAKVINGKKRLMVKLNFDEPSDKENYYRIELHENLFVPYLTSKNEVSVRMITIPGEINTEKNWLIRGMGLFSENDKFHDWAGNRFYIFADRYIQGNKMSLELDMPYFRTDSVLGTNRKIYLQSISRDYFYYLRSVMQQLSTTENPFNEPVRIHTNINGGVGIFGAFSQSVDSLIHINRALIDSLFPGITIPGNLYPLNYPSPAFIGN